MINKRFISVLVLIMLVATCLDNLVNVVASSDIATVTLGTEKVSNNFSEVNMGDIPDTYVVKRGGKEGWLCDKSLGTAARYVRFNLDNSFLYSIDDGTTVNIEVEYFDSDNSHFTLVYDGKNNVNTNAEIVYMGASNEWKKHTFIIDDPYFADRIDGKYDFQIGIYSIAMKTVPANVVFGSVNVRKYTAKNPVSINLSTNEAGNIFANKDEKLFRVQYENLMEDGIDAKVLYEAVRESGSVVWSKEDNVALSSKQTLTQDVTMDFNEYNLFSFRVTLKENEKNINTVVFRPFSVVNSDEDGVLNDKFRFNLHWDTLVGSIPAEQEIFPKSNSGGIRSGFVWRFLESSKGKYQKTPGQQQLWDYIVNNKLDSTLSLHYGNPVYSMGTKQMPKTDEELKAWVNYCIYVAEEAKKTGVIKKIEVWNEPAVFNETNVSFTDYAKLCEITYNTIKGIYPEIKIGVGSITGVYNKPRFDQFLEAMDAGMYKYADAITLHPYYRTISPENIKMADTIKKYVDEFTKRGKDNIEVWLTEYGFTKTDFADYPDADKRRSYYITNSFIQYTSLGICDTYDYYDLGKDGIIEEDREHNFGVLNNYAYAPNGVNSSATLPFLAIANMNYLLADAEPTDILNISDNVNIYRYKSNKFGKDVAAMWAKNGVDTATVLLDTDKLECYDMLGNKQTIYGNNGQFSFYFDETPLYIVGDFKKIEKSSQEPLVKCNDISLDIPVGDIATIELEKSGENNLSLKIDVPSNVEVVKATEFVDNKALVYLKAPNKMGAKDNAVISVYDGDRLMQFIKLELNYTKMADVKMNVELADRGSLDYWMGIAKINNISSTSCINGNIKFNKPSMWENISVPIGNIPAGLSSTVKINFPQISQKGMYFLDYDLILNNGEIYNFTQSVDFTMATFAKNKPVIDGIFEDGEWPNDSVMVSKNPEQVKLIKDYGGANDLSAKTNIMWDEDYFYMGVQVKDDIFFEPEVDSRIWAGDSVQFGIFYGEEGSIDIGQAGTQFTEIGVALSPKGEQVWRWSSQDNSLGIGAIDNFESKFSREGTTTYYEVKLPWKEILPQGMTMNSKNTLGFSMLVNDNDGSGRRGWIEYASGLGQGKNTALFTYLKILEEKR